MIDFALEKPFDAGLKQCRVGEMTSDAQLLELGERSLALAWHASAPESAAQYLELAVSALQQAECHGRRSRYLSRTGLVAACQLELLPVIAPVVIEGTMPGLEVVEQAHRGLVQLLHREGERLHHLLDGQRALPASPHRIMEVAPVLTTYTALALLQHFQVVDYQGTDWLALPAFGEPSLADQLCIFQRGDETIEQVYAVHVAGKRPVEAPQLPDGVSMVWFSEDLRVEDEPYVMPFAILSELYKKQDAKLRQRVGQLLEVLDMPERVSHAERSNPVG